MHPLDGAFIRLDRAKEHLAELKAAIGRFINREYELTKALRDSDPNPPPMGFNRPGSPVPPAIAILVGEVVYNLRASLDYLVYELAILDSGTVQHGTQFLIEDVPQGFARRRNTRLRGIDGPHTTAIERLQPYNGVQWSRWLRSLSNPDKHRHLLLHRQQVEHSMTPTPDPTNLSTRIDEIGILAAYGIDMPDGSRMYMQFHSTYLVTFDDGLPVIQTLEEIAAEVGNTLTNFQPEF